MAVTGIGNNNVYEGTYAAQKMKHQRKRGKKILRLCRQGTRKKPERTVYQTIIPICRRTMIVCQMEMYQYPVSI